VTDAAIEQRDEEVVEAITSGRSLRAVQRQFGLTLTEFDQALERCFPLDVAARMRMIRGDLAKLDKLIDEFYQKAVREHDPHSAIVAIKAWERKHDITGAGAAQRIDLTVMPKEHVTGYEKITAAIERIARRRGNGSSPPPLDGQNRSETDASREDLATGTDRERDMDATWPHKPA
jgi:hypothetical protein